MGETTHLPEADILFAENRVGQFSISEAVLRERATDLLPFFGRMVIVRCEHLYASRRLHYSAFSPEFAPVPEYQQPPEYVIGITDAGFIIGPAVVKGAIPK